jgi:Flp pilus assembly pilin Flp
MYSLGNVWTNDEGQDLIEYALLAALIAILVTASITNVKNGIVNAFTNVSTALNP